MYKGIKNVVLKIAWIIVIVTNVIACTACTTVTEKLVAANAALAVWSRVVVNCAQRAIYCAVRADVRIKLPRVVVHCVQRAIYCAVRADVRIDWRMALNCARIAISELTAFRIHTMSSVDVENTGNTTPGIAGTDN